MANIGSFKKVGDEFQGEILTLSVQTKNVRIVAEANRSNDNAPNAAASIISRYGPPMTLATVLYRLTLRPRLSCSRMAMSASIRPPPPPRWT